MAGGSAWTSAHLDPDQIWRGHRIHYARLKRHACAQFRAKLARHRPRLLTLLGLAAEARGEALTFTAAEARGEAQAEG